MSPKEQINLLTQRLNRYNDLYYQKSISEISDQEFDNLLKELEALEKRHPEYKLPDSPTHRVGGTITKEFSTVEHTYPMLSLSNTYSEDELREWDERVRKGLLDAPYEYMCEIKFDGISLSMTYEDGVLVRGVTRGDGTKGDDITSNVKTITTLPLRVAANEKFEIRGEGFMPNTEFEKINTALEMDGKPTLANPRNAASGTFKMQDSRVVASRKLDCYIYQYLSENDSFKTHSDSLNGLKELGFNVSASSRLVDNIEEAIAYIHEWDEKRHTLPCATDGIVIKVNSYVQREDLGFTAKSPRWAIAYKYKAETKSTKLKSVTYQVGRTGAITPVAELEPVELSMTTVRRATLHNADEMERLGLIKGDHVWVQKAGEIIPKIVKVDEDRRSPQMFVETIKFISECPACGTKLQRNEGEAAWYCPNEKTCPPQVSGRIEHFIQRKALDIDSLGQGKIEILIENGLLNDPADLYDLTFDKLIGLEKVHIDPETGKSRRVSFKEKTVENILKGIEASKQQSFEMVLFGLGIRFVGQTTAAKLASFFGTIENLKTASEEILLTVPDVGEKVAKSIVSYFQDEDNLDLVHRLQEAGLSMKVEEKEVLTEGNALEGMIFLYSGTFENYSRSEIEEKITANGGKLVKSVSKKLTYLLVGSSPGPSKIAKAQKLDVKIIDEATFEKILTANG